MDGNCMLWRHKCRGRKAEDLRNVVLYTRVSTTDSCRPFYNDHIYYALRKKNTCVEFSFSKMARQWISFAIWLLLYVKVSLQDESCSSPTVTPNMYTTTDGMIVSDIAFIVELSVTCQNGAKDLSLYAVINDVTVPVVKSLDNNKYQFSWTRDPKNVQNGEQTLRVYDEEGFSVLRKVMCLFSVVEKTPPTLNLCLLSLLTIQALIKVHGSKVSW
ncbi:translocon-associated protein subunit delta-like isoform X2 [Tachypleus tridentatus]|uniref:translocon-associated protein subunit delta-like isoform X2 n=1 Tax=Tachypleus tridentatus TaxID=6853 RepID=UPI003FD11343